MIAGGSIRFDDAPYQRSHGKAPRGFGVWAFSSESNGYPWFANAAYFADAKQQAREHFGQPEQGLVRFVYVCP